MERLRCLFIALHFSVRTDLLPILLLKTIIFLYTKIIRPSWVFGISILHWKQHVSETTYTALSSSQGPVTYFARMNDWAARMKFEKAHTRVFSVVDKDVLLSIGEIHPVQKWSSNWVRSSPARIYFETSKFSRSSVWQKKLSRAQWIYSLIISLCLSSLARVCLHAKRRKKKENGCCEIFILSYFLPY